MTWSVSKTSSGRVERILIEADRRPLPFGEYFRLLAEDSGFAAWYGATLAASTCDAFFWEHPPVIDANLDSQAELVLVDAPRLAAMRADSRAFRRYFDGGDVVSFRNLGGDAKLVAPSPKAGRPGYAHLALFLREAPADQVAELWRGVGRAVGDALSSRPLWLSTSGLGVAWLHVRLDATPKYYQHQPYRFFAQAARARGTACHEA